MDIDSVTIEIEGDYLNSFIYSGVLILVDTNFNLTAYSWADIVSHALIEKSGFEKSVLGNYFNNSSSSKIPNKFINGTYLLSAISLKKCPFVRKNIGV